MLSTLAKDGKMKVYNRTELLEKVGSKVPDIATGRNWIEEIRVESTKVLNAMRADSDNPAKYNSLRDYHYELKKARQKVQEQLSAIFRANYKSVS